MAYRKVFAMQKQWSVEVVRCINEWANCGWYYNETKEPMHSSLNEPMNQEFNEPMNQWINEFSKSDLNAACVFTFLKCKSSSRSCAFFVGNFSDQGAKARKQRPYFGDPRSHITRKNAWFRARECFYPWVHTLPNCYKQPPEKNDKYIQIPWNWIVVNNAKCNVYCFWSWRYIVGLLENGVCPPNGLFLQGKWW